tara:strand:+ start:2165 stop:2419 length:255 start_codon:yes stop_codon:yes gene_type:complete
MNKIVAIMLFLGALPLPMDYYSILRLAVSIAAIINIFNERYIFIPVLVLFNPIIPIYLYSKAAWVIIDIIAGMLFWAFSDEGEV